MYSKTFTEQEEKKIPMKSERVVSSRQERLQASEVLWVLSNTDDCPKWQVL